MAEMHTLARPYAKAVFAHASEQGQAENWSTSLAAVAALVDTPQMRPLLGHPAVTAEQLVGLCLDVAKQAPDGFEALLKLLASHHRLAVLPAITAAYEQLRADHEQRVAVSVSAASPLESAAKDKLVAALKQRLNREVDVSWAVDEDLLGGVLIKAGDLVIDGSVRGDVERLRTSLIQ